MNEGVFAVVMFILYLVATSIFSYTNYQTRQMEHESSVRSTLLTAAVSSEHIIGLEFGQRFNVSNAPDPLLYRYIVDKLSKWVTHLPITYVYLIDKVDEKIYFVISNETEKDKLDNTLSEYYKPYKSAPEELWRSFYEWEPVYTEVYENEWGSFQSVFVPIERSDGSVYVLAADIKVENLEQLLYSSIVQSVLLTLVFLLPLIPMLVLYFWLQRRKEAEFKHSLLFDSVTGLANSHCLQADLYNSEDNLSGILLNLVDTDDINTVFGRTATDALFTHIGVVLTALLPSGARLYRVRVREFFVLYDELDPLRLQGLTQTLLESLNAPMPITSKRTNYSDITVTAHAGIVVGVKKQRLVSRARGAMETAQEVGRPFCFYSDGVEREKQIEEGYFWQKQVLMALSEKRLLPYFQPIYDIRKRQINRYEILVRLQQRDGQIVGPNAFLPAVRRSHLYRQLTRSMIEQGFAIFSGRSESVSVNLCKSDLLDQDTPQFLLAAIERYGMQGRVTIEVVESDWIGFQDEVLDVLTFLKHSGVCIAIDDFGSGYSNFDQLLKMEVDYLKIDGSLVSCMFTNEQALAMVKAIINLANGLGIPVIPEYVENQQMLDLLKVLGCEYAQGYVIGAPMSQSELPENCLLPMM